MRLALAGLICCALSACGGGSSSPPVVTPPVVTPPVVTPPLDYLVQSRCGDGTIPKPGCADGSTPAPLTAGAVITERRADWGNPNPPHYYVLGDAALMGDGVHAEQTWDYSSGPFNAANGDGGEIYAVGADGAMRIVATEDGGTPGMQYFAGPECGLTGWVGFRDDATTTPQSLVATLAKVGSPGACPAGASKALTLYRRQTALMPFIIGGQPAALSLDIVISDHYNTGDPATASAVERSYWGRGFGRVYWAAYGPSPPSVDLTARCPRDIPFDTPPAGMQLEDCRVMTQIVAVAPVSIGALGWPPAGFQP